MFQLINQLRISQQQKHIKLLTGINLFHTKNSLNKDYYAVLKIEKNSTKQNIKQAYYKLSKQHHPDINDEPNAEAKFKEIQEAYHVLGDETRKNEYDRSLSHGFYETGSSRQPFSTASRSGPGRTTTKPTDGASNHTGRTSAYDFDEYYRSHYNDRYKSKSYSSGYSASYGNGARMSQQELNNYWNKKRFGSHDEIKDAYKRLIYSIIFSCIIMGLMLNVVNKAVLNEQKRALAAAEEINQRKLEIKKS